MVLGGGPITGTPISGGKQVGGDKPSAGKLEATPLEATSVPGAKSPASRLARTDKSLLGIRSDSPVNVVVKLDYDSIAAYQGGVRGLAPTSPSATGNELSAKSSPVRSYVRHIEGIEGKFLKALDAKIPAADPGRKLRTVYGGVALRVPGSQADELLQLPGVVAVQRDKLNEPLTDSSPEFIGATTLYRELRGTETAGQGVIFASLDTGIWPEHPSFGDRPDLPAPPPKADGTPRTCDYGDNPTTPETDVFECNNKLIGGQPFLDTYNSVFDDEVFPDSARDANGHGTHTASTVAGNALDEAELFGVDRGPLNGIAPGAYVSGYKVCGPQGCFGSDSAAAVAQAILDGARVINFSISGGVNPYTDVVELAFLDAYAAGVFVAASAGNSGPGAGTVNHNSPWVTTVAASLQERTFQSTVTLQGGGESLELTGASITAGIGTPTPVVSAAAAPYSDSLCQTPAPAGTFDEVIVACERGVNARVAKGFNVRAGGAVGMLLYNPAVQDQETDNHWIPTVHLDGPEGDQLLAFLAAHSDTTATFTDGQKAQGQGDVMAAFSSRGPGQDWLKPDITAPGVQILAGHTPVPDAITGGPPGELFQAIAGTSMSSPHVAGSAALMFDLHGDWTPGMVKSALMTTAEQDVVKEDKVTPADPFDYGGGRVDLTRSGEPGLVFDESATDYALGATDPDGRIDLNVPSVNAPQMPGRISTSRVAQNVSGRRLRYRVETSAPAGARIRVRPERFTLRPGERQRLRITIIGDTLPVGQYFGEIRLENSNGRRDLHLPVAFFRQQGDITLRQVCDPTSIVRDIGRARCEVTVQNNSLSEAPVGAVSRVTRRLEIASADGARQTERRAVVATGTLFPREPDRPTIAPGTLAGYIPLDSFGITPTPVGDEEALNFDVPAYVYAGQEFTTIGATSNGYLVAGGANTAADIAFIPQDMPDEAPPNGVLAPFWTDLDGTTATGIFAGQLTDGVNDWIVIEWRLNVFGTSSPRVFQAWVGVNGVEDVTFAYDPANLPADPGIPFVTGAENAEGSAGDTIDGLPTEDLRVTSAPGAPGGTLTYSYEIRGLRRGFGEARTSVETPLVRGKTTDFDAIRVR